MSNNKLQKLTKMNKYITHYFNKLRFHFKKTEDFLFATPPSSPPVASPSLGVIPLVHPRHDLEDDSQMHSKNDFVCPKSMFSFREEPTLMPFCHIWYNDTKVPVVSQVSEFGKVDARLGGYPNPEIILSSPGTGDTPIPIPGPVPVPVA